MNISLDVIEHNIIPFLMNNDIAKLSMTHQEYIPLLCNVKYEDKGFSILEFVVFNNEPYIVESILKYIIDNNLMITYCEELGMIFNYIIVEHLELKYRYEVYNLFVQYKMPFRHVCYIHGYQKIRHILYNLINVDNIDISFLKHILDSDIMEYGLFDSTFIKRLLSHKMYEHARIIMHHGTYPQEASYNLLLEEAFYTKEFMQLYCNTKSCDITTNGMLHTNIQQGDMISCMNPSYQYYDLFDINHISTYNPMYILTALSLPDVIITDTVLQALLRRLPLPVFQSLVRYERINWNNILNVILTYPFVTSLDCLKLLYDNADKISDICTVSYTILYYLNSCENVDNIIKFILDKNHLTKIQIKNLQFNSSRYHAIFDIYL
ncbi:hypothetical protein D3C87_781800 [compost metagenome]